MANYFSNRAQGIGNTAASTGADYQRNLGTQANQFGATGAAYGANAQGAQNNIVQPGTVQPKVPSMTDTQFSSLYQAPATTGGPGGSGFTNTPGYQNLAGWGGEQFNKEAGMTSGAVDPKALQLSQRYQQNYQMTPQEIQELATSAGRTVGNQFQSMQDTAAREGAAAGMSEQGILAAQGRLGTAATAQEGATMADARLNAQLAALGVEQNREATRLGAEQAKAGTMLSQAGQFGQEVGQATNTGEFVLGSESKLAEDAARMGQQGQQAQFEQALQSSGLSGQQHAALSQQFQNLSQQLQSGMITEQEFQLRTQGLMAQIYGTSTQAQLGAEQQAFASRGTPWWQQVISGVEGAAGAAFPYIGKFGPGGGSNPYANQPGGAGLG